MHFHNLLSHQAHVFAAELRGRSPDRRRRGHQAKNDGEAPLDLSHSYKSEVRFALHCSALANKKSLKLRPDTAKALHAPEQTFHSRAANTAYWRVHSRPNQQSCCPNWPDPPSRSRSACSETTSQHKRTAGMMMKHKIKRLSTRIAELREADASMGGLLTKITYSGSSL